MSEKRLLSNRVRLWKRCNCFDGCCHFSAKQRSFQSRLPVEDDCIGFEWKRDRIGGANNIRSHGRMHCGSKLNQVQVLLQELQQERDVLKARVSTTSILITARAQCAEDPRHKRARVLERSFICDGSQGSQIWSPRCEN